MESNAADYLTAQDCSLYTVGSLEDRHYAFGFPKGILWSYNSYTTHMSLKVHGTGECSLKVC